MCVKPAPTLALSSRSSPALYGVCSFLLVGIALKLCGSGTASCQSPEWSLRRLSVLSGSPNRRSFIPYPGSPSIPSLAGPAVAASLQSATCQGNYRVRREARSFALSRRTLRFQGLYEMFADPQTSTLPTRGSWQPTPKRDQLRASERNDSKSASMRDSPVAASQIH